MSETKKTTSSTAAPKGGSAASAPAPKPAEAPRGKPFKTNQERAAAAAAAMAARDASAAKAAEAERKKPDPTGRVWFLRCRHNPSHMAVFMPRKPALKNYRLEDDEWFASYKPLEAPWMGPVLCQVCREQGKRKAVSVRERHLGSISQEEFEKLMEGGDA